MCKLQLYLRAKKKIAMITMMMMMIQIELMANITTMEMNLKTMAVDYYC
jgi:hypothetical protein